MSARLISIAVIVILLVLVAYLEFLLKQKPYVPTVLTVRDCGDLEPRMKRIGEYGLQFDVPVANFTPRRALFDTPTREQQYDVRSMNSTSDLAISWYAEHDFEGPPEVPALTFTGYVEKRQIVDDKGKVIGEDYWGTWDKGERWRRVRFWGGIAARYGSRNQREVPAMARLRRKTRFFSIRSSVPPAGCQPRSRKHACAGC